MKKVVNKYENIIISEFLKYIELNELSFFISKDNKNYDFSKDKVFKLLVYFCNILNNRELRDTKKGLLDVSFKYFINSFYIYLDSIIKEYYSNLNLLDNDIYYVYDNDFNAICSHVYNDFKNEIEIEDIITRNIIVKVLPHITYYVLSGYNSINKDKKLYVIDEYDNHNKKIK